MDKATVFEGHRSESSQETSAAEAKTAVHLADGSSFVIEHAYGEVKEALQVALVDSLLINVTNKHGKTYAINPHAVTFVQGLQ
jgi:hypothetical protein